jgi:drug/metabolite transporter (DMT)-like permease
MHWLIYSISATIFLGISMVFYKLPSHKNCSSFISTIVTNTISGVIILSFLFLTNNLNGVQKISWYGLLWGAVFSISMVLYKKLLSGREAGIIFPIISSIGNTITVLVGVLLLNEVVSPVQALGVLTIVLSVYFFQRKNGSAIFDAQAIWIAFGILTFSTIQKFVQKLGATSDSVQEFMLFQYFGAAIFALILTLIFERKSVSELVSIKKYLKGGFLISVFSVLGGYAILKALSLAPLSKVYAIHPMYTFVTAMLGIWLFNEKFTYRKMILILFSIVGVILIRIG